MLLYLRLILTIFCTLQFTVSQNAFATPHHLIQMGLAPNLSGHHLAILENNLAEFEGIKQGPDYVEAIGVGVIGGFFSGGPAGVLQGLGDLVWQSARSQERLKEILRDTKKFFKDEQTLYHYLGGVVNKQYGRAGADIETVEGGSSSERQKLREAISRVL